MLDDLVESGGAAMGRSGENRKAALLNLFMVDGQRAMAEVLYLGPMEEPLREITESRTDGDCWFWNIRYGTEAGLAAIVHRDMLASSLLVLSDYYQIMAVPGKASGMQQ